MCKHYISEIITDEHFPWIDTVSFCNVCKRVFVLPYASALYSWDGKHHNILFKDISWVVQFVKNFTSFF